MIYEIKCNTKVVGTTEFEAGDPSMGFVSGSLTPTSEYIKANIELGFEVFVQGSRKKIECDSVTIEDMSEEFGEQAIEVTALLVSAEEYEIYFNHHNEAYAQKFK